MLRYSLPHQCKCCVSIFFCLCELCCVQIFDIGSFCDPSIRIWTFTTFLPYRSSEYKHSFVNVYPVHTAIFFYTSIKLRNSSLIRVTHLAKQAWLRSLYFSIVLVTESHRSRYRISPFNESDPSIRIWICSNAYLLYFICFSFLIFVFSQLMPLLTAPPLSHTHIICLAKYWLQFV